MWIGITLMAAGRLCMAGSHSASALPRSTPEAQGVASSAIREFVEAADREVNAMNSFMLVRHGQVIAEGWWTPYAPEVPHMFCLLYTSDAADE